MNCSYPAGLAVGQAVIYVVPSFLVVQRMTRLLVRDEHRVPKFLVVGELLYLSTTKYLGFESNRFAFTCLSSPLMLTMRMSSRHSHPPHRWGKRGRARAWCEVQQT